MSSCMKTPRLWLEALAKVLSGPDGIHVKTLENKNIEGSICMIIWHADNLKIRHKEEKVIKLVIEQIEEKFEK